MSSTGISDLIVMIDCVQVVGGKRPGEVPRVEELQWPVEVESWTRGKWQAAWGYGMHYTEVGMEVAVHFLSNDDINT